MRMTIILSDGQNFFRKSISGSKSKNRNHSVSVLKRMINECVVKGMINECVLKVAGASFLFVIDVVTIVTLTPTPLTLRAQVLISPVTRDRKRNRVLYRYLFHYT